MRSTPSPDGVFKALADPTRRAIFESLMRNGEQTVRALTDESGVSQPMVSKHLGVLKLAGLVRDRPEGRLVHYRADPSARAPLLAWMKVDATFWRGRVDGLENRVHRQSRV